MVHFNSRKKQLVLVHEKLLQWLCDNGFFEGDATKFLSLSDAEQKRLRGLYEKSLRLEYDRGVWGELYSLGLYFDSFDNYCGLDLSIRRIYEQKLVSFRQSQKNFYEKKLMPSKLFAGSFEEYMALSRDEKQILRLRVALDSDLMPCVSELDKLGGKLLSASDESNYFVLLNKFKDDFSSLSGFFSGISELLSDLEKSGVAIPADLQSRLKIDFKFPKLGIFDTKYSCWSQVVDSEYVIKLKTRQVFSKFNINGDFSDKSMWKNFFDDKNKEYAQFVAAGIYSKSFEEYLSEDSLFTFELLGRFRFPQTNVSSKNVEPLSPSTTGAKAARASYENAISEVWSGTAALNKMGDALDFVSDVLAQSGKKPDFSFEPGSSRTGIWGGDRSGPRTK